MRLKPTNPGNWTPKLVFLTVVCNASLTQGQYCNHEFMPGLWVLTRNKAMLIEAIFSALSKWGFRRRPVWFRILAPLFYLWGYARWLYLFSKVVEKITWHDLYKPDTKQPFQNGAAIIIMLWVFQKSAASGFLGGKKSFLLPGCE